MTPFLRSLALALLFCPAALPAEALLRGPYLQLSTPHSVIVRWRTDVAGVSQVNYGLKLGGLDYGVSNTAETTEHEVKLTGLQPGTTYYYSIGQGKALAGPSKEHYFVTHPLPGSRQATRIWVLGDAGTKGCGQREVRDAYLGFMKKERTDFVLQLGDNAYGSGLDEEFQKAMFQDMYEDTLRNTVFWSCLGNHETYGPKPYAYWSIYNFPTKGEAGGVASGTKNYYSFDYGNIHFISLDSMDSSRKKGGPMYRWLESDLAAATADWIVAFFHHPPYTKGSHDSDIEEQHIQMREVFNPLLEDYGVDLVLGGHSHCYERSHFLDGHYGTSASFDSKYIKQPGPGWDTGAYTKDGLGKQPHAGAVYVVAGSAGQATGGALNHPAHTVSLNLMGSLLLDIEGGRLDAAMIDKKGRIQDAFTLLKGKDAASAKQGAAARARLKRIKAAMSAKKAAVEKIHFDFEKGAQGWAVHGTSMKLSTSSALARHGKQSLAIDFEKADAKKSDDYVRVTEGLQGLKPGATVNFNAWMPEGAYFSGVEPYVSDSKGNWTGTYAGGYTPGAWNSYSVGIPCDAAMPIKEIGFYLFTTKTGKATVYLDAVGSDQ